MCASLRFGFYSTVLLIVLILSGCSDENAKTPKELALRISKSIFNNDIGQFEKFIISREDAIAVFEGFISMVDLNKSQGRRSERFAKELISLKSGSNTRLMRAISKVKISFFTLIQAAKKDGVNLEDAKFVKVTKVKTKEYLNRNTFDIYFLISFKGQKYTIKLDDVVDVPRGLVLLDRIKWRGKRRP